MAKTTVGNALAAVRCHPAGSTALAALIAAGVICYAFFVTVTVRFTPHPAGPPVAAPSGPQIPGGRSPGSGASGPAGTRPSVTGRRTASPSPPETGSAPDPEARCCAPGQATDPAPLPTGTWSAPGGVLPPGPAGPVAACLIPAARHAIPGAVDGAAPSPPRAAPGDPGGLCLQLGPLGVCLSG